MNHITLQNKLHSTIPMTKWMQLNINKINKKGLYSSAPLNVNVNDKGTAFGGSLSTITIISSWSLCDYLVSKLGYEKSEIVIYKNNTQFLKPVTKEIQCITHMPLEEDLNTFQNKLERKKRASLQIQAEIIEDNNICVQFEGTYVIKVF